MPGHRKRNHLHVELLENRCLPSTVTNLTDHDPGSLRDAIATTPPGGIVEFQPGLVGTINLTTDTLVISKDLTIKGPGNIAVSGHRTFEVFQIASGVTVSISGLTIINGFSQQNGGGIGNQGTLTVSNCTISGNRAWDLGGGIFNSHTGTLMVNNSNILDNNAGVLVGGLGDGGGIYTSDVLMVSNSTFFGNQADNNGGGIFNDSILTVISSTISGNLAGSDGGGIANFSRLKAQNTILAGNTAVSGPDVYGPLESVGHNLVGNTSDSSGLVSSDLRNVNPLLGPLQDNGGPTQTMALLPGSPALDAGDPALLSTPDQRGVPRTGGVNIGPYQASASILELEFPPRIRIGIPFELNIALRDRYHNSAAGYRGTVHFMFTQTTEGGAAALLGLPPGFLPTGLVTATDTANPILTGGVLFSGIPIQVVLPSDYTFTAADGGVHTFTAVRIDLVMNASPADITISSGQPQQVITVNASPVFITISSAQSQALIAIQSPTFQTSTIQILSSSGLALPNSFGTGTSGEPGYDLDPDDRWPALIEINLEEVLPLTGMNIPLGLGTLSMVNQEQEAEFWSFVPLVALLPSLKMDSSTERAVDSGDPVASKPFLVEFDSAPSNESQINEYEPQHQPRNEQSKPRLLRPGSIPGSPDLQDLPQWPGIKNLPERTPSEMNQSSSGTRSSIGLKHGNADARKSSEFPAHMSAALFAVAILRTLWIIPASTRGWPACDKKRTLRNCRTSEVRNDDGSRRRLFHAPAAVHTAWATSAWVMSLSAPERAPPSRI
jgi:hypothetical protein